MSELSIVSNLSPTMKISRIMGGLWQIADQERLGVAPDTEHAAELLQKYVDKGIFAFDLADHYGSSELIAGSYHAKYQQAVFCTKWVPQPSKSDQESEKKQVRKAVELSLQRMGCDRIDLLQYHAWNYADPIWLDHLFWLQELQKEGLIKHLGVTNFDTAHLRVALHSGVEIVSNQICYSLLDQRASGAMAELATEYSVKILAFGTLAGGFLSEKWLDQPPPSQLTTWSQMKYKRFIEACGGWPVYQRVLKQLHELAQTKQCNIPQLATRYILDHDYVAAVIIGLRLGENDHSQENLNTLKIPWTPQDQQQVTEILEQFEAVPGDCGDEYRTPPFLTASGDLSHHIDQLPAPYPLVELGNTRKVFSGTAWEKQAGYCRAIQKGKRILVSGTTATHGDRVIGGSDPEAQAHFIFDKIEGALQSLGATMQDVVRTRIYIRHMEHWAAVAKAHGIRFKDIQPANTLVQAPLVGDEYLVEVEAEAQLD